MNAHPRPGPDTATSAAVATARDLVDLTLQGAEANARPDLVRRLTAARDALDAPASPRSDAVRDAAKAVLHALDTLEVDLRTRRATLADPSLAPRLRGERDRARDLLQQFQARASTWGQVLAEGFAAVSSDVDYGLLNGIRTVVAEAEEAIAGARSARSADRLDQWLTERLIAEAAAVQRLLRDGARAVAARLAAQLELPDALPVRAPSARTAAELVAGLPARPPATTAPSRAAARLLTVGMPTYGGLLMGVVVPRFLGLALPAWVFLVCSVAGALTMGGAAWTVERHQQREARRTRVRATLRTRSDDWHLALGKQARDALRGLQQELRDATAAAVGRRAELLDHQYRAARAAADAAEQAGVAMGEIAADLDSIRQMRARARGVLLPTPRRELAAAETRLLRVIR
ncbi:hypothetical protein [Geodermatophilus sp. URMC 62]|uniref:hypothetical protein n=1 Tax=Geodermatophilus sp. URMC 62 TaxID=3423414 RepID=UPI00406CCB9F